MIPISPFVLLFVIAAVFVIIRMFLSSTSMLYLLKRLWRSIDDRFHVYQFYKVPEYNSNFQENQLYKKVSTYVSSLASIEDSDFANLFSGKKSNEISVQLDSNQIVYDTFLSARISWKNEEKSEGNSCRTFVLKIKKRDKRRILRPYLQHIHTVSDEIELRKKEVKLYTNTETDHCSNGRWRSVPFTHPTTLDTVAMDSDLKNKVKSDLESFLKSKQYYHRLGRVWKRSYLLHGPPGTGKSSFVAAMAKFLCYDIYDIDLSNVSDDSDLKMLLLQTTNRSVIVIEDLDRFLNEKSTAVSLSGILNFMDGIFSSCGEERVMVITMNSKEQIDPAILRPGRIDVQIYFPLCDFTAFKTLANSYLGLKDHKLFPQVEEIFQTGATLSPAEIGEIMIVNRSSPSRALKSVITALQDGRGSTKRRLSESVSTRERSEDESSSPRQVICRESVHTVKEFRKLYGLLRLKSSGRKTGQFDLSSVEKEG
ncbi:AAA+ ATPase domain [Macleaya cordata]|uniref:AAA+ ATPase domain n=1 Tax=Macleaya cordata TaxID=56857 RepID=A0A200RD65_MACCD|nr:AAA+ ATPase domain [Macleaya cordata]